MTNNLEIGGIYTIDYLIDEIGAEKLERLIKDGIIFKIDIGSYEYYG